MSTRISFDPNDAHEPQRALGCLPEALTASTLVARTSSGSRGRLSYSAGPLKLLLLILATAIAWVSVASSQALAVGVGEHCANRTCDAGLNCSPSPIIKRCVPVESSFDDNSRFLGESCFDSADCVDQLECRGGNANRPYKRRCHYPSRPDVTDMIHGDSFLCGCATNSVEGGRLVKDDDVFDARYLDEKLVAKFDLDGVSGWSRIFDGLEFVFDATDVTGFGYWFSPLHLTDEIVGFFRGVVSSGRPDKTCICTVVEDLTGGWEASNATGNPAFSTLLSAYGDSYETHCLGVCGAHCGKVPDDPKRYGSLIVHDVCQAFIGSESSMLTFAGRRNSCGDEGFKGGPAMVDTFTRLGSLGCQDGDIPDSPPGEAIESPLETLEGDFDGDGLDDAYEVRGTDESDVLRLGNGDEYAIAVDDVLHSPLAGDFDGDGSTELLWREDDGLYVWDFAYVDGPDGVEASDTLEVVSTVTVASGFSLYAGDFDGDGISDLFAYAAGGVAGTDHYLFFEGGTLQPTKLNRNIKGAFQVMIADFTGNGVDEVFLYSFVTGGNSYFHSHADRSYKQIKFTPGGPGLTPVVLELTEDGLPDILWKPGTDATPPMAYVATGDPARPFVRSDLEPAE